MFVNVPAWARSHFWEEPPPGHHEFWSFGQYKPPCEVGDPLLFRFDGKVVARAVVCLIEKPGQSECAGSGRFRGGWKVYWEPDTFEDLRGTVPPTPKPAAKAKAAPPSALFDAPASPQAPAGGNWWNS